MNAEMLDVLKRIAATVDGLDMSAELWEDLHDAIANEERSETEQLARAFSIVLESWLDDLFPKMVAEHIEDGAAKEPYCVSHDYRDANMAMDAAFRIIFGRRQTDDDVSTCNAAWTLAKKNNFYYAKES